VLRQQDADDDREDHDQPEERDHLVDHGRHRAQSGRPWQAAIQRTVHEREREADEAHEPDEQRHDQRVVAEDEEVRVGPLDERRRAEGDRGERRDERAAEAPAGNPRADDDPDDSRHEPNAEAAEDQQGRRPVQRHRPDQLAVLGPKADCVLVEDRCKPHDQPAAKPGHDHADQDAGDATPGNVASAAGPTGATRAASMVVRRRSNDSHITDGRAGPLPGRGAQPGEAGRPTR
jgi:hypothetical protein